MEYKENIYEHLCTVLIITSPSVVKFEILNRVNPVILSTVVYLHYSI